MNLYGVYLCGCTDCFLHAVFAREEDANAWLEDNNRNPEGGFVKTWKSFDEVDRTDTGFE